MLLWALLKFPQLPTPLESEVASIKTVVSWVVETPNLSQVGSANIK